MDVARGEITVTNPDADPGAAPMRFTFDQVYDMDTRQVDLYDITARPIVDSVLEGYNGTIFAYGQTGCGKTFTMSGVEKDEELRGVIPRAFRHTFEAIAASTARTYMVRASFLEIYNEEIRDLLGKDHTKKLDLRETVEKGVYVQGLTQFTVSGVAELETVLSVGNKNRSVGATAMNQDSSRSHSIFTITVECTDKDGDNPTAAADGGTGGHIRQGKLNLVDLAGSERQSKTHATGQRLKEATKINLSLSALGNVISALVDGKSSHIPYRDSKLTRMLQDSLGGNTKTCMCANVSPADYNYDETISTLRYANRAKNIKNKPKINEDPKDTMIREMQEKVAELKARLAEKGGGAKPRPPPKVVHKVVEEGPGEEQLAEIKRRMAQELQEKMKNAANEQARQRAKEEAEREARAALEKLLQEQDKTDGERRAIQAALAQQHAEMEAIAADLEKEQREKEALEEQLRELESKVIDGGKNLLDEVEELEKKAGDVERDMMVRKRQEEELNRRIEQLKEEEMMEHRKYKDMKEEVEAITRRLAEVRAQVGERSQEANEVHKIQQHEREDLLSQIRELEQIIKLRDLVMLWFIPQEYFDVIKENCYMDPETDEWVVGNAHLAGNAVRAQLDAEEAQRLRHEEGGAGESESGSAYFSYKQIKGEGDTRATQSAGATRRPGTAARKAGKSRMATRPTTTTAMAGDRMRSAEGGDRRRSREERRKADVPRARGLVK